MKNRPSAIILLSHALLACPALPAHAAELVALPNATLAESASNDGDSFQVRAGGRALHLRLYYVDCPETAHRSRADLERMREQQRHFGLEDLRAVVEFGGRATGFTRAALARPFIVHTAYAHAPGRSAAGRYYAFIETANGDFLGRRLVAHGLARVHGKTRAAPDGTSSDLVLAQLRDLRDTAMLKRAGIWRASDPDLIAELRALQRAERLEFEALRDSIAPTRSAHDAPLDLNTAPAELLQQIPRIGPVKAAAIIAGRPYRSVRDLLKVPGIGEKTLEAIAPYVAVGAD